MYPSPYFPQNSYSISYTLVSFISQHICIRCSSGGRCLSLLGNAEVLSKVPKAYPLHGLIWLSKKKFISPSLAPTELLPNPYWALRGLYHTCLPMCLLLWLEWGQKGWFICLDTQSIYSRIFQLAAILPHLTSGGYLAISGDIFVVTIGRREVGESTIGI